MSRPVAPPPDTSPGHVPSCPASVDRIAARCTCWVGERARAARCATWHAIAHAGITSVSIDRPSSIAACTRVDVGSLPGVHVAISVSAAPSLTTGGAAHFALRKALHAIQNALDSLEVSRLAAGAPAPDYHGQDDGGDVIGYDSNGAHGRQGPDCQARSECRHGLSPQDCADCRRRRNP